MISLVFRVYRAGANGIPGSPGFDVTKPRTPGLKNETRGGIPSGYRRSPELTDSELGTFHDLVVPWCLAENDALICCNKFVQYKMLFNAVVEK